MAKVCDCFPELKEITEAREGRYRTHPEKEAPEGAKRFVEVKVTSIGQLNELVACKKSGYKFLISEPAHVGGQNCAPTPLEFLLSGAVGCYAAVFAFYAAKLGVAYDTFEAVARTEFDARGHMIADAPASAFRRVMISVQVMSDAPHRLHRLPPALAGQTLSFGTGELPQRPLGHTLDHLARGALEALLRALAAPAAICCFFDLAGMASSRRAEPEQRSWSPPRQNVCEHRKFRPTPCAAYRAGTSIGGAQFPRPCAMQSSRRRCSNMALASQIPPPTTTRRKNRSTAFAIRRSRAVSTYFSSFDSSKLSMAPS